MSRPDDAGDEDGSAVVDFVAASRDFCNLIEAWRAAPADFEPTELLARFEPLLGELYLYSLGLPETSDLLGALPDEARDPTEVVNDPAFWALAGAARESLRERALEQRFPEVRGVERGEEFAFRLAAHFGGDDSYISLFVPEGSFAEPDPYDPQAPPYHRSLGEDLGQIYDWLRRPLVIWDSGSESARGEALFEWRLALDNGALRSAIDALRAIFYLLHERIEEDYEAPGGR